MLPVGDVLPGVVAFLNCGLFGTTEHQPTRCRRSRHDRKAMPGTRWSRTTTPLPRTSSVDFGPAVSKSSGIVRVSRWIVVGFVGGVVFKAGLLLLWTFTRNGFAFALLTTFDPVPLWLADNGTRLLFDLSGIAPSPAASHTFDVLTMLGSGLQWAVAALLIEAVLARMRRGTRSTPSTPDAP